MAETVRWMVVREPEQNRRVLSRAILAAFLVGGLIGGIMGGLVLASASAFLASTMGAAIAFRVFMVAMAASAVAYAGHAAQLWTLPRFYFPHQVPQAWREAFNARVAAFIYAAGLGFALFTRFGSLLMWPFLFLLFANGHTPLFVVGAFALSGLLRASTALVVPAFGWFREDVSATMKLDAGLRYLRPIEGFLLIVVASVGVVLLVSRG